ncbi:MAG TPA: carbohydrate kinase family protein [Methylophaga aminisulfidivorans]|uniref:Carbohydrate kinase family protein n=2 Tax=root TaxID=1 RepID=A0A7C1VXQ7_9GAMM|nr:carbohydrate kinase family protein [Methylophaga aminisulfidivorans]HEC74559.1 carbohydrate kinase family protein [Methylophaga aminisulfidivorans]
MSVLICGSFAFDNIMVFPDKFKNHILPDKVHMLNVAFLVPELRREFGGCAGNIAYNLKLLGDNPIPMGTVGTDFTPYGEWMDAKGINREHVHIKQGHYTAQAFITTDQDDNQITAFHPGAMNVAHETSISEAKDIKLAIVAPDGRDGMLQHAEQLKQANIPFIFDPGQGLPMFNGEELLAFAEQATYLALNDYEAQLFMDRTGLTEEEAAKLVDALIITRGAQGSHIYTEGKRIDIACEQATAVIDPTGCGDAYRAGLLHGILHGKDWEETGRIASKLGALKIAHHGTQNHQFDVVDILK